MARARSSAAPVRRLDAKIGGFTSLWGGAFMFGALGSIFLLTGAGMMLSAMLNAQRASYLTRHGKRVHTTVERVERNENLKVNGLNPYRIFTRWQNPSTSETRVFESDYIWFDPSSYLNGRSIAVFIGPRDPRRYYVDLSFLPKHAEQT
jgi:hypothetical protein